MGAYRGKYTKDEIKELDAYASMFGGRACSVYSTLAHLHNALKWPGMDKIRDLRTFSSLKKRKLISLLKSCSAQ